MDKNKQNISALKLLAMALSAAILASLTLTLPLSKANADALADRQIVEGYQVSETWLDGFTEPLAKQDYCSAAKEISIEKNNCAAMQRYYNDVTDYFKFTNYAAEGENAAELNIKIKQLDAKYGPVGVQIKDIAKNPLPNYKDVHIELGKDQITALETSQLAQAALTYEMNVSNDVVDSNYAVVSYRFKVYDKYFAKYGIEHGKLNWFANCSDALKSSIPDAFLRDEACQEKWAKAAFNSVNAEDFAGSKFGYDYFAPQIAAPAPKQDADAEPEPVVEDPNAEAWNNAILMASELKAIEDDMPQQIRDADQSAEFARNKYKVLNLRKEMTQEGFDPSQLTDQDLGALESAGLDTTEYRRLKAMNRSTVESDYGFDALAKDGQHNLMQVTLEGDCEKALEGVENSELFKKCYGSEADSKFAKTALTLVAQTDSGDFQSVNSNNEDANADNVPNSQVVNFQKAVKLKGLKASVKMPAYLSDNSKIFGLMKTADENSLFVKDFTNTNEQTNTERIDKKFTNFRPQLHIYNGHGFCLQIGVSADYIAEDGTIQTKKYNNLDAHGNCLGKTYRITFEKNTIAEHIHLEIESVPNYSRDYTLNPYYFQEMHSEGNLYSNERLELDADKTVRYGFDPRPDMKAACDSSDCNPDKEYGKNNDTSAFPVGLIQGVDAPRMHLIAGNYQSDWSWTTYDASGKSLSSGSKSQIAYPTGDDWYTLPKDAVKLHLKLHAVAGKSTEADYDLQGSQTFEGRGTTIINFDFTQNSADPWAGKLEQPSEPIQKLKFATTGTMTKIFKIFPGVRRDGFQAATSESLSIVAAGGGCAALPPDACINDCEDVADCIPRPEPPKPPVIDTPVPVVNPEGTGPFSDVADAEGYVNVAGATAIKADFRATNHIAQFAVHQAGKAGWEPITSSNALSKTNAGYATMTFGTPDASAPSLDNISGKLLGLDGTDLTVMGTYQNTGITKKPIGNNYFTASGQLYFDSQKTIDGKSCDMQWWDLRGQVDVLPVDESTGTYRLSNHTAAGRDDIGIYCDKAPADAKKIPTPPGGNLLKEEHEHDPFGNIPMGNPNYSDLANDYRWINKGSSLSQVGMIMSGPEARVFEIQYRVFQPTDAGVAQWSSWQSNGRMAGIIGAPVKALQIQIVPLNGAAQPLSKITWADFVNGGSGTIAHPTVAFIDPTKPNSQWTLASCVKEGKNLRDPNPDKWMSVPIEASAKIDIEHQCGSTSGDIPDHSVIRLGYDNEGAAGGSQAEKSLRWTEPFVLEKGTVIGVGYQSNGKVNANSADESAIKPIYYGDQSKFDDTYKVIKKQLIMQNATAGLQWAMLPMAVVGIGAAVFAPELEFAVGLTGTILALTTSVASLVLSVYDDTNPRIVPTTLSETDVYVKDLAGKPAVYDGSDFEHNAGEKVVNSNFDTSSKKWAVGGFDWTNYGISNSKFYLYFRKAIPRTTANLAAKDPQTWESATTRLEFNNVGNAGNGALALSIDGLSGDGVSRNWATNEKIPNGALVWFGTDISGTNKADGSNAGTQQFVYRQGSQARAGYVSYGPAGSRQLVFAKYGAKTAVDGKIKSYSLQAKQAKTKFIIDTVLNSVFVALSVVDCAATVRALKPAGEVLEQAAVAGSRAAGTAGSRAARRAERSILPHFDLEESLPGATAMRGNAAVQARTEILTSNLRIEAAERAYNAAVRPLDDIVTNAQAAAAEANRAARRAQEAGNDVEAAVQTSIEEGQLARAADFEGRIAAVADRAMARGIYGDVATTKNGYADVIDYALNLQRMGEHSGMEFAQMARTPFSADEVARLFSDPARFARIATRNPFGDLVPDQVDHIGSILATLTGAGRDMRDAAAFRSNSLRLAVTCRDDLRAEGNVILSLLRTGNEQLTQLLARSATRDELTTFMQTFLRDLYTKARELAGLAGSNELARNLLSFDRVFGADFFVEHTLGLLERAGSLSLDVGAPADRALRDGLRLFFYCGEMNPLAYPPAAVETMQKLREYFARNFSAVVQRMLPAV